MKIKTSELTGAALDWAVAKCEFPEPYYEPDDWLVYITPEINDDGWAFSPSTDWAQGGPIIERAGISIDRCGRTWTADIANQTDGYIEHATDGPTPLIAAMRCHVASKLGDEVEVPDGLV